MQGARLRSWLLAACTGAAALYIGLHAAPLVGQGSVEHAARLLHARQAVLQRTGADRVAFLASASDRLAESAVRAGAVDALLQLVEQGGSEAQLNVTCSALAALVALATTPPGAEALRRAPGLLALQGLASSQQQPGETEAQSKARESATAVLVACGQITHFRDASATRRP